MLEHPSQSAQRRLFEEVWLNGRLEEHLDAVYRDGLEPDMLVGLPDGAAPSYTKLAVARAAARVSRARGRGGG